MANKKEVTFIKVGSFEGPIKNGKYENWEAEATVKGEAGKGNQEVVISVGSKGMADKFKAGTYTAFYSGKTDNDVWRVTVLASDNEGLGAPKQDGFGGGSGGGSGGGQRQQGGYTRNPDEGCMASACGLVKSLIESGKSKITDVPGALEALELAFVGVKKIMAVAPAAEAQKPAEETKPDLMTQIRKAIADNDLEAGVRDAGIKLGELKQMFIDADEDIESFVEALNEKLDQKADAAPEDEDDLPF